jgi:hypothetical protein
MGWTVAALAVDRASTCAQPTTSIERRAAVEAPDHEAGYPRSLGLEQHDIADTCFVQTSSIVDDKDFSWLHSFKGLEKNIDASDVANGAVCSQISAILVLTGYRVGGDALYSRSLSAGCTYRKSAGMKS